MPLPLPALTARGKRLMAWISGAVLLWLVLAFQLFVNVDPLSVHRTDVVIMLGGAADERLPVAEEMQRDYGVPVLVLSHTDTPGNAAADAACNSSASPSVRLLCFRPGEYDTRGEARAIGRIAKANGWKSITVVTSSYHVARAQRLMQQCTTAEVQMVNSHPELSLGQWLRRFVIETGGLMDVSLRPECASMHSGM
ncbi:YdcF family protein [Pseudarthrobacter sp. So.54]